MKFKHFLSTIFSAFFGCTAAYCVIVGATATSGAYWYMGILSLTASISYGVLGSKLLD